MNVLTLLNNTARLGSWGIMTLYHMAIRILLGLLFFFFPDEVARRIMVEGVIGSELISHAAVIQIGRVFGIYFLSVGLLFGLFGSVADEKARLRLNYFTMFASLSSLCVHAVHIYMKYGLLTNQVLVIGIFLNLFGFILCSIWLFFHTNTGRKKKN